MDKSRFFGTLVLAFLWYSSLAQATLQKQKCRCGNTGYQIIPVDDVGNDPKLKFLNCSLSSIIKRTSSQLNDSSKIRFIEGLLQFRDDSSLTCIKLRRYTGTGSAWPQSKHYTLQVYALYIINWLMFYNHARVFCPYPVLFDEVKKKEINNDQKSIKEVFDIYIRWYGDARKGGYNKYPFPLSGTRFMWYGGRNLDIRASLPANDIPAIAD